MFERQGGENQGAFSKENLKQFAADLGLDTELFNQCLDDGSNSALIQADTSNARSLGVTSTPAFVINGRPVLGAQPYETFVQIIEEELAKTSN